MNDSWYVDLHSHSTASDGSYSPSEVVRGAAAADGGGCRAIALTDHDTVAGCAEAARVAAEVGIEFLPGIEISCEFPRPGTMHLLGYGVDPASAVLAELTRRLIEGRTTRNERMVALLQGAGIEVSLDELLAQANGGTVGRPHLAAILVRKGYCASTQEAFDQYLGQGGRFYIDKETTTSRQAIEMIRASGGIAVLAHPVQLRTENYAHLDTVVKSLVDQGLEGIEVLHSDHPAPLIEHLETVAKRYGLLPTGGSDFHGKSKPHISLGRVGGRRVPWSYYAGIKERLASRRA